MMELITRAKLMIHLLLLFVITQCGNNLMMGTNAGEIRRNYLSPYDTINKVSLTQKGYIQFLKYVVDVPALSEFTFCLWMRSDNLNFSHPLFSYSRDERDRLIRVWISDKGKYVNMAILETEVFKIPLNVKENHWNHFCPSWNSKTGTWSFYFNGKLMQTGLNYKLRDSIIPGKGDIIIGQEYTDFNKGLDDGIEGDVYGFNLVTSSTTPPKFLYHQSQPPPQQQQKTINYRRQMYIPSYTEYVLKPTPAFFESPVVGYFSTSTTGTRAPKGLMDFGQSMLNKIYSFFDLRSQLRRLPDIFGTNTTPKVKYHSSIKRAYKANMEYLPNMVENSDKTLGMFLVELSYDNCVLGRGAPLIDDKVIVSWTRTPVRVFGGAILKTVTPFCKKV